MRMHLTAAAAGFLLVAGIGAAAADTVVIQPEQETVIREYVKKQPLAQQKPAPACRGGFGLLLAVLSNQIRADRMPPISKFALNKKASRPKAIPYDGSRKSTLIF
ncbi:hypothetical protein [Mesorhizobium amorphae]|uniref:hypothetical protein n=1 Tax=Mesorhizobium amorphae TaxID=71433 RepID=UPI001FEDFDDD|nr:hypothetical protein [Mesorhizobium amorphae]